MDQRLAQEAVDAAWAAFAYDQDITARNALMVHYQHTFIRPMAKKLAAGLVKSVDHEDLLSAGLFGLLDAMGKYDPARGVKFESYAQRRVWGSMVDEVRSLDWAPRGVHAKVRGAEAAEAELHALLGRTPTDFEIADYMEISPEDLWEIRTRGNSQQVSLYSDGVAEGLISTKLDPASNPEDIFGVGEMSELLANAVALLPQRFKIILVLYYLHQRTLAEIGEILGVTESRACQLHSKLLKLIHEGLSEGAAVAA
jgi:RNA polymerase sigma factor for flagellar operon FliA